MANNADQVAAFSSRGPTRDGRVNLDAVLAPPRMTEGAFSEITPGLRTGEVYTTDIDVKSAAIPLRVVMAYSDYPGSVLVNNLNLIKTYSQENLTAMKTLIGQSAQGTWILRVLDLAGRDIGKLNRWGLKLTL
jgi:hypothetical protein